MKQNLSGFLRSFIPFALLLCLGQYFIMKELSVEIPFYYSTWSIYLFHVVTTLVVYLALITVNEVSPDKTGMAFLAASVIKMLASVIFLVPLIRNESIGSKLPDVMAFFIPYFLFLIFETAYALKLINKD